MLSLLNGRGCLGLCAPHRFLLANVVHAQATAASAADLAESLQRKYDTIKDFSADFVHTYRGGVLRREPVGARQAARQEAGQDAVGIPGPEEKLFVADGIKIYTYIPQDKQVMVSSVPPDDQATTPALFLAGREV